MSHFRYDDGGRAAAGFKGSTGDCCCRAVAIASGLPYQVVYDLINEIAKRERTGKRKRGMSSAREGVYVQTFHKVMQAIEQRHGIKSEWVPTMTIGSGCKVHCRADELPSGRLILNLSRHFSCMIDGMIRDTHDPSRDGTRCVYGYYRILGGP